MRSSRKGRTAPEKKRDFKTERLVSQHQRLYQALNLGTRSYDGRAWKWQFADIEGSIVDMIALNFILSNLKAKDEKQVREKLHEKETGSLLINNLCGLSVGKVPSKYFKEMTFLLSTILHRWPSFRCKVWSNTKLMDILGILCSKPDNSLVLAVLKLYTGLALCGKGASKLLENEEVLLPMLILFMGESYPLSIRIGGFRLARCLVTNEQGCLTLMRCCCEPFVQAVMCGLRLSLQSSKVATEEMMLLMEASRLALVLRWEGKHNDYFWKEGIDRALLDLLGCSHDEPAQQALPVEEQISTANEHLQKNFFSL